MVLAAGLDAAGLAAPGMSKGTSILIRREDTVHGQDERSGIFASQLR